MKKLSAKQRRLTTDAALAYVESRDPRRYTRTGEEEQIVRGWLQQLPAGAWILDCPCGTGRFVETAATMDFHYLGGDVSPAMIQQARKQRVAGHAQYFFASDAESLPLPDNSVDCVLLWRLLHHIPDPEARQRMLREAARVSRDLVLVSFHHPISFTFARRCVKRLLTNDWEISDITHWRLAREASECGLDMVETKSFGKYRSINWFACLKKQAAIVHIAPRRLTPERIAATL